MEMWVHIWHTRPYMSLTFLLMGSGSHNLDPPLTLTRDVGAGLPSNFSTGFWPNMDTSNLQSMQVSDADVPQ